MVHRKKNPFENEMKEFEKWGKAEVLESNKEKSMLNKQVKQYEKQARKLRKKLV
jgi:hypothetical protein